MSYLCKWVRVYIIFHIHLMDEKAIIMKWLSHKRLQDICQTAFSSALLLLRILHPNLSRCFLVTPYLFHVERQTERNWERDWFINEDNSMLMSPFSAMKKNIDRHNGFSIRILRKHCWTHKLSLNRKCLYTLVKC